MRRQVHVRIATTAVAVALVAVACSSNQAHPQGPPGTSTPPGPQSPGSVSPPGSTAGWLAFGQDPQRSGDDPTSPAPGRIRQAWTSPKLDGAVYAQPLITAHAVIVATEADSVYSLDPSTGAVRWRRHLATPVNGSSLPCGDIDPSGITGTPVIDPATQLVWVVTFSSGPDVHTLWALRLADGTIAASRPADPPGSDPASAQQRGALALGKGRVYIPFGGLFGDCGDYHGTVLGLSTATGTEATATRPLAYTTPAGRAGIWAPPGPVVDRGGDILVATGNGLPVEPAGDANSVIRLTPDLAVSGRFTSPATASLSQSDQDFGSTSPTLVGDDVLQVGKAGVAYLLDPGLHVVASAHICAGGFGGTAVASGDVFLSCFDGLYAVRATATGITVRWKATSLRPGPPIVAGGVVWTVDRGGHVDGFDARTGRPVYTHDVSVAGSFPTLAAYKGALYVADGNRVAAFTGI